MPQVNGLSFVYYVRAQQKLISAFNQKTDGIPTRYPEDTHAGYRLSGASCGRTWSPDNSTGACV